MFQLVQLGANGRRPVRAAFFGVVSKARRNAYRKTPVSSSVLNMNDEPQLLLGMNVKKHLWVIACSIDSFGGQIVIFKPVINGARARQDSQARRAKLHVGQRPKHVMHDKQAGNATAEVEKPRGLISRCRQVEAVSCRRSSLCGTAVKGS